MRLHRLDISAFGPYAGHEVVDFDALGADGLFLLHGETGAGKTTLLDAVAFALFGVVPGSRGEAKRLRCDSAAADIGTEVVLELTLQGQRLQISRSPAYERPKRKGEGFTPAPAKASLSWLEASSDGSFPEALTRIDEVSRTIQGLLGMNAEQFFQVVLLPQGEFAKFLRAETAEREQLLEKLFGTHRFGDIEGWFRELRTKRGRELDTHRQGLRELAARLAQAAQQEIPEQVSVEWTAQLSKEFSEAVVTAEENAAKAKFVRDDALKVFEERRELAEKIRRVRLAHENLTAFSEREHELENWGAEIAAARRAVGVMEIAEQVDERVEAYGVAQQIEQKCLLSLEKLGYSDTASDLNLVRKQSGVFREEAGALAGLSEEADQQHRDLEKIADLTEAIRQGELSLTSIKSGLAEIPDRIAGLRTRIAEARDAEVKLGELKTREHELATVAAEVVKLPAAELAVTENEAKVRDATDKYLRAKEYRLQLHERRLTGMAAELASSLTQALACPVCGSEEHPSPAIADQGEVVDREKELLAEQAEKTAEEKRDKFQVALNQAQTLLAGLRAQLGERTVVEVTTALVELQQELKKCAESADTKNTVAEELSSVEAEQDRLTAELKTQEQAKVAAETERRGFVSQTAARAKKLDMARGEFVDVQSRRAYLNKLVTSLDALVEARSACMQAQQRQEETKSKLDQILTRMEFSSLAAAKKAVRSKQDIEELEKRISHKQAVKAAALSTLAEPELAAIKPDQENDFEAAKKTAEEVTKQAEEAAAILHTARGRAKELHQLADQVNEALQELEPTEEAFAELDALTDVVNGRGQNSRKISLRSYVLAARLEEVAFAATARLRTMSQGRYSFVHSDSAGARGTRGGLGLDVLDDYSGMIRPTKTLSGGESFLASLALALGLADVVAAETGGALLDTLFIDEGFGTLDAETLDVVMDVLDELRAGGRVVGLVSHVEELRQRIPIRLRIRKSRSGSTMELQGV